MSFLTVTAQATAELTSAECQAMVLDGELYRIGDIFVPIAITEGAETRAGAIARPASTHLAIARRTAAWVWVVGVERPRVDQFLVDLRLRSRLPPHAGVAVMESVLEPGDLVTLGGVVITSPLRTTLDLCRFEDAFGADECRIVRELGELADFGCREALAALKSRPRLAGKRRAIARLTQAWTAM